ncbi:hypothetical protein PGT21_050287 [Puccinia graminis f. sp. tritici]|uniref:Uncharacterized protein n=1 Tax=Puccinia graminis f. sp. tritici TaxID=56615 RepID=A0A5B0MUF2_PUCGR|nr:hypothetical protein PGT21_050287 [Puccinia graminis f. sp. tritici]KAA1131575.1 hypothetical protein PGTUg99_050093 [Puccinia graminis f. sp. tritici]
MAAKMSHFGLDLLGGENLPPGYFSASKYWRIQGVGDQLVQMVDCDISYKLFSPKDALKPQGAWNMCKSKQKFQALFPVKSTSLDQFQDLVAKECKTTFKGTEASIQNALQFGSPHIGWNVLMKLPAVNEFLRLAEYTVIDKDSYSYWISTIVTNGKDQTKVILDVVMVNPASVKKDKKLSIKMNKHNRQQAAAQEASSSNLSVKASNFDLSNILANKIYVTHLPNVKYQPKLPVFIHLTNHNKYIPLTTGNETKSPEPDSESNSVINLQVNLLNEYLKFVKIPPGNRDGILHILTENKATNPQLF